MSKGTKNRIIRMSDEDWRLFEAVVAHRNEFVNLPPWTMSDFVRIACREKIEKMNRSRGRSINPNAPPFYANLTEEEIGQEIVDFNDLDD